MGTINRYQDNADEFGYVCDDNIAFVTEEVDEEDKWILFIEVPALRVYETRTYANGMMYKTVMNLNTNEVEHSEEKYS